MLARRYLTILPPLTEAEALEVTKSTVLQVCRAAAGTGDAGTSIRSPHHTISSSALIGGRQCAAAWRSDIEPSWCFILDEFPEFSRTALERPVFASAAEDGYVTISRVQASLTFPANFIMCTAQNPCPCGYLGDKKREYSCKQFEIELSP